MEIFKTVHQINIAIHVLAGTAALLIGLVALVVNKGKKIHLMTGRLFLYLVIVVIVTGLIGVFVFGRNTFLLVITVLSGYLAFSGYRIIKTKTNAVQFTDLLACLLALTSVLYFLYYFKTIGMIWSPVIIYSTVGYLILIIVYDLCKYLMPRKTYANLYLYEHIVKMVSAFSGLLSAFAGTVFSQYQPYSQFIPSILGTFIAIGFVINVVVNKKYKPQ